MKKKIQFIAQCKNTVRNHIAALRCDERGEGYLDMAMKILIIVVVGAAILAIMRAAMPTLFQDLIDKVSSQLSGVTIVN